MPRLAASRAVMECWEDGAMRQILLHLMAATAIWLVIIPGASGQEASVHPLRIQPASLAFHDLPRPVQNAIRGQAGSARVDHVETAVRNGKTNYVAIFNRGERSVRLELDGAGKIANGESLTNAPSSKRAPLAAATKVEQAQLPAQVQQTLRQYAQGASIADIDKGTLQGKTVYDASFKSDGKTVELRISQDGSLVRDDVNDRYVATLQEKRVAP